MAKKTPPELQVVIPYSQLCDLLTAAQSVEDLQKELARLDEKLEALRHMQTECMDKIGEVNRLL